MDDQREEWEVVPPTPLERMKEGVYKRDRGVCAICGKQDHWAWHCHHIVPRGEGGPDTVKNGATLCEKCHAFIHPHMEELNRVHDGEEGLRVRAFRRWYKTYTPTRSHFQAWLLWYETYTHPRPNYRRWLSDMLRRDWFRQWYDATGSRERRWRKC